MKTLTWGIYAVVFGLPLYLVRFRIFGIPTTALEILIYILFILWLVKEFRFREFKKIVVANRSLFFSIILILIGVSLATIFSSDLRISAGIWKAWFVDPILLFIVLISVIREKPAASQGKQAGPSKCGVFVGVLYSLFLSGTVVSIIALIYLILGKLNPVGRLQAFYTSPNYLAMYLAPALIIGFGFLVFRNSKHRFGFLLGIVLLLVVLFFTYSYGVWLGIITAVCFGLVLYCFKLKKIKLAILILCLFILTDLFIGYLALTQRQTSLDARLIIWQKAIEIFKTNPVLGIGPGTFGNYFPTYPEWGVPQPHNIFLAFLLQTGLIGFIGFIWLLIWFFRKLSTLKVGNLTVMDGAVMIYILAHGLLDTTYWKNDLSVLFWIIIALMAVIRNCDLIRN